MDPAVRNHIISGKRVSFIDKKRNCTTIRLKDSQFRVGLFVSKHKIISSRLGYDVGCYKDMNVTVTVECRDINLYGHEWFPALNTLFSSEIF